MLYLRLYAAIYAVVFSTLGNHAACTGCMLAKSAVLIQGKRWDRKVAVALGTALLTMQECHFVPSLQHPRIARTAVYEQQPGFSRRVAGIPYLLDKPSSMVVPALFTSFSGSKIDMSCEVDRMFKMAWGCGDRCQLTVADLKAGCA